MSQENVEIVRRLFKGWSVGDFRGGVELLDPSVAFIVRPPFPEPTTALGPEAIHNYLVRFFEQWMPGSHTMKAERIRGSGDTVLVDVLQRGQGRTSGIEGDMAWFMLFTLRAGTIVRIESVWDRDEALEAAGLSE